MTSRLQLAIIPFVYVIENQTYTTQIGEFIIDGKSLADWLEIERGLDNCYTELDIDKARFLHFANQLIGETEPSNQFDTPRLVLYRCHCGCDYCGVVSAEIITHDNSITWQNVGYEDDDNMDESEMDEFDEWQLKRLNFTFDKTEYFAEIEHFKQSLNNKT